MSQQSKNRRTFLKMAGSGLLLSAPLALLNNTLRTKAAMAQGGADSKLTMIKESDPQAKSLGYVEDAKKVDPKKWPKRAGSEGAKQFCWNCMFYVTKDDPKATKSAPCTILSSKGVMGTGWCNTWTQNPKVKA